MAIDKLILRPNAKLRFLEVLAFYTDIDENLGRRFNEQVEKCLNYIKDNPYLFRKCYGEIRVCYTTTFPYAIFYIVKFTPRTLKERVYVINILHTKRKIRYRNN